MVTMLETARLLTDILSGLATTAAILVGGWWFLWKRGHLPRAVLEHVICDRVIGDGTRWLHVSLIIRNEGDHLLRLGSPLTRVQQVFPPPQGLLEALNRGEAAIAPGSTEMAWPLLAESTVSGDETTAEIEPHESDRLEFDFFLPISALTIEVYSYVWNTERRDRQMGWRLTTVHEMGCQSQREEPHV